MTMNGAFYGKYRGVVIDSADPRMLGRIRAKVPDVFGGDLTAWCMPCVPCRVVSLSDAVPDIGSNVWIEFEQGDSGRPIWSGCFWDMPPPG
jgi:hypothetical protein